MPTDITTRAAASSAQAPNRRHVAAERIDQAELERLLLDPTVPDSALRPYLKLEPVESQAYRPTVVVNPAMVTFTAEESALALASLNAVSRWRRQTRYRAKIGSWTGLRVVAEGDSWFQFPFLVDDIIDHLFDRYAIYCVSGAGDLITDMARQDELSAAVAAQKPNVVLLSGGGNDLLGDGRLAQFLLPFNPGRPAADYIKPEFTAMLGQIVADYAGILRRTLAAGVARIVCHTYDYAVPAGGQWLGRPMLKLGIADPGLQRAIVRVCIDRFHAALSTLAAGPEFGGKVAVVDCRGAVGVGEWFDELHPSSAAFGKVAAKVAAAIGAGIEAAPLPESIAPPAIDAPALRLLAVDEAVLLAEIGRRSRIMAVSPEAAGGISFVTASSSEEGIADGLKELGGRIFDRLHRELHSLLCSEEVPHSEERRRLRDAFGLGEASMVAAITGVLTVGLGVAPLLAPLIAAILVKRGVAPAWETTCEVWTEQLGK